MEILVSLWHIFASLINIGCVTYCFLHIFLPKRFIHPLKIEISCREKGCKWAKTFNDRTEGDSMSMKLMDKMKAAHKAHFLKEHPEEEWIYG